ncbi:GH92 family glycosyl hydrolase [Kutzneria sp. NPDC052558]|uniref:GH92 family glycosyl hydrolase n=1 Tax=Kutzneria sp. NPDC052558 TaxID=3364121 RepID=UPI0037C8DD59
MRPLVVTLLALVVLAQVSLAPPAVAGQPPLADPVALTDPMIGTGSAGAAVGEINNFPGPSTPFGMLQWSPDTADHYAGYSYEDKTIKGFSLTHASVGCRQFGDVPILPVSGDVGATPWSLQEPFTHTGEQASPGYYTVTAGGVKTELTTAQRAGQGRFTFPAGAPAHVLVKAGGSLNGDTDASVAFPDDRTVTGSATSGGFCGQGNKYTVHYMITFDRPFTAKSSWSGNSVAVPNVVPPDEKARGLAGPQIAGPQVGATLDFDVSKDATLKAKVAISFVSVDGAAKNLAADAPAWDFAGMQAATKARWASYLGRIAIGGGQTDQLKTFYAALYHSLQYPVTFNDVDGSYAGFDGKVHNTGGRTQYANFSGWDIYRCEIPLLATLAPDETSDMMQSLVNDADQYGWLPKWPVYNDESGVMNGDSVAPIIAGAYAFGARDFDAGKALAQLVKGATTAGKVGWGYEERPNVEAYQQLGYVPSADNENVSMTEEYAIDDFAIGRFASALGDEETAATFATRGQNWQHVFDPTTGYVRPHDADGAYPAGPVLVPPPPGQFAPTGFAEGNAAQYTWMVPQNLAGLIGAIGGRDAAIKRLDDLFTKLNVGPVEPYYWAGNEPMFSVPWTYDYLGQPWKTQDVVRRVQSQLFAATPDGEPGNDDLGAQSAWYVWSALGLYPVTPGATDLAVNTPLFPHVEIRTGSGRRIVIDTQGAGPHIQGLSVNGIPWNRTGLPSDLLAWGGRVQYRLGDGTGWNAAPPKSYRDGEAPALGYVTPLGASTGNTFQVGARNQTDQPVTVPWTLTVAKGATASLTHGQLLVPPNGTKSVPVTIQGTANGIYPVTADFGHQQRATAYFAVAGTDHTTTGCSTLGATNTDCGLTQIEYANDGATAPVTVDGVSGRRMVHANDWGDYRYMYFQADQRAIPGTGPYNATITVRYLDSGTDTFVLQYDSVNQSYVDAKRVTKTGTGTWKEVTVTVADAKFAHRENGQSDFRISSDGSGDAGAETIAAVNLTAVGADVLAVRQCPVATP